MKCFVGGNFCLVCCVLQCFFAFVEKVAIFAEEAFAIGFQLIEWRLDAILLTFKFYVYEKAFCCLGFFVLPVGL